MRAVLISDQCKRWGAGWMIPLNGVRKALLVQMGALVLSAGSLAIDRSSPAKTGPGGLFGWVHERYLPATAWLAAGPGLLGHASLNALLRWLHPLQVWGG